jgi:hypothetical protein
MNEAFDPLEAELSALRPLDVSPALRFGVARRLADAPRTKLPQRWLFVLAGGLAASCLAMVVWRNLKGEQERAVVGPRMVPWVERILDGESAAAAQSENVRPSLLACERALSRSPEAFDALIGKLATQRSGPSPRLAGSCITLSDVVVRSLLGEEP